MENISYNIKGRGKTILLIHGWSASKEIWNKVINKLSKKYRVITIDLPGHGKSSKDIIKKPLLDYMTDILYKFIKNNKIKPYAIIAHSMGGLITLKMLKKYNIFLDKLMILGTPYCGLPKWISIFAKQEWINYKFLIIQKKISPKYRNLITRMGNKIMIKDCKNFDNVLIDSLFVSSPYYISKLFKELSNNCFRLNGKLNIKSVFIARGEFDPLVSREKTISLARFLNAEFYQFKGISHIIMLESPNQLSKKILDFLKKT